MYFWIGKKINSEKSYWNIHQSLEFLKTFLWLLLEFAIGTHSLHVIRSSLFPSWNLMSTNNCMLETPCPFCAIFLCSEFRLGHRSHWIKPMKDPHERSARLSWLSWNSGCGCKSNPADRLRDIPWSCWSVSGVAKDMDVIIIVLFAYHWTQKID